MTSDSSGGILEDVLSVDARYARADVDKREEAFCGAGVDSTVFSPVGSD